MLFGKFGLIESRWTMGKLRKLYHDIAFWFALRRVKKARQRGETIPVIIVDDNGKVEFNDVMDWLFVLQYDVVGLHLLACKLAADYERECMSAGVSW